MNYDLETWNKHESKSLRNYANKSVQEQVHISLEYVFFGPFERITGKFSSSISKQHNDFFLYFKVI